MPVEFRRESPVEGPVDLLPVGFRKRLKQSLELSLVLRDLLRLPVTIRTSVVESLVDPEDRNVISLETHFLLPFFLRMMVFELVNGVYEVLCH